MASLADLIKAHADAIAFRDQAQRDVWTHAVRVADARDVLANAVAGYHDAVAAHAAAEAKLAVGRANALNATEKLAARRALDERAVDAITKGKVEVEQ